MPTRINGIGTAYFGKRDLQIQQGVCESCQRSGPLANYETRLWFTIVFIPVIPLTRQQILNYCAKCTRHRVLPINQWREVQANAISGAIAKVDANPDSPEHAMECHATMAACGKREEAGQYADAMLTRFGNNVEVLMYLGSWFERIGQTQRADQCFDKALVVDPKHPGAQRAAAVGLLQAGKPREAEAMLATSVPPSPLFEPGIFFMLAEAYQTVGDHASAARVFKMVADTTPAAAKEKKFRKAVEKSEAALGQYGSVLAPIPWYKRSVVWWPALGAAVLVAVIGLDRYFAHNREVFVVNGVSKPLKVRLDSGNEVEVGPFGQRKLAASEGRHTISVIEPAALAREEAITIPSGVIGRWGGGQVNIADPTRSAIVVWEESVYAEDARDQSADFKVHVGEPFSTFDHIDYKFEQFPHTVRVEGRTKSATKHRVGIMNWSPVQLLMGMPEAITDDARMDYLESHLATDDGRAALLQYYWAAGIQLNQLDRCREYLKKSLDERPVDIEWHRSYQSSSQWSGKQEELAPEYDTMLAKDLGNPDLLYLRGRIESYSADSENFFDEVLRKDPQHGYTWAAKAYQFVSAGKFEEGLAAIEKAIAANSDRGEWKATRRNTLQALGRHDQVIRELEEKEPQNDEADWVTYPLLIDVLLAQGKIAEANEKYAQLVESLDRDMPGDPLQLKLKGQLVLLMTSKKYDELRSLAAQANEPMVRSAWSFIANLGAGQLDDAAADTQALPLKIRSIDLLCLSIAWRNAHKEPEAQASLQKAIELMAEGPNQYQIVAGWLREPPADLSTLLPQVTELVLEPDDKAIVLLALAGSNRPGTDKLIESAKHLNAWPSNHNDFVDVALSAMR